MGEFMNIFLQECKMNKKSLLFWLLGIFALTFAGITKYSGLSNEAGQNAILEIVSQVPKILLAVLGIADVDFTTLQGYYTVIHFYIVLCGSIYGIHLGTSCVTREFQDKTYEFLFSKPRSRIYILGMKSIGSIFFVGIFSAFYFITSILAVASLKNQEPMFQLLLLSSLTLFVTSILFFAVSSFLSIYAKSYQRASVYGNVFFLYSFLINIAYRAIENTKLLKIISPLNYFDSNELLTGKLNLGMVFFVVILILVLEFVSLFKFRNFASY
jgi:ABC-2 type transport system permease protein